MRTPPRAHGPLMVQSSRWQWRGRVRTRRVPWEREPEGSVNRTDRGATRKGRPVSGRLSFHMARTSLIPSSILWIVSSGSRAQRSTRNALSRVTI